VTVSRNFIVKQGTYSFVICRQSQARMKLINAVDVHNATNYHITVIAPNVDDFKIFIHSEDIDRFKEKLAITIEETDIEFESITTRFIREASKIVENNKKLDAREFEQTEELCLGCSMVPASARLSSCNCRGLFCKDCLIRCFMAKQNPNSKSTWLSASAPCPNCRQNFNLLNICEFKIED